MTPLAETILWCIVQVTLVGLVAWLLCVAVSRWIGPGTAAVPAAALAAVVMLTALAFAPWPAVWRFGPDWLQAESPSTTADEATATSGSLTGSSYPHLAREPGWQRHPDSAGATSQEASTRCFDTGRRALLLHPKRKVTLRQPRHSPGCPLALFALLGAGVLLGLLRLVGGLLSVRNHRRRSQPLARGRTAGTGRLPAGRALPDATGRTSRERRSLATAATVGWSRPVDPAAAERGANGPRISGEPCWPTNWRTCPAATISPACSPS